MNYHGDIALGSTIDIKFTSRQFSTGAPFTLAGTPVISAYIDNSLTQLTAGITLTVDFDGVTGLNNVRVVATSGNGYTTASNVQLVITTGTVNAVSVVGEVIGSFSIENRSELRPTVAGRTLDVSAGGEAGIDWANVGTPSTAVNLSATTVNLTNTVTTYTGNTPQTGDSFARIGAAGAGLTAVPWNAAWDAEVQSEVEDALVVHRLDELLNADSDIDGAAPPTVGSVFHELLTKTAGSFTYDQTTDSLEALRDNTGTAGAGLTSIDLPNQTMDITGNITGNLSGSVGSVTGAVGSVTGLTAATVHADLDDIQARLPAALTAAGNIKADVIAVDGSADAADRLQQVVQGSVFCTVGAASSTTSIVTSAMDPAAAVIDQFKGRIVTFKNDTTTANLRGQSTDITASSALGILTVTALTTAPVSGDTFTIS